jgi:hypothetical protein
VFQNPIRFGARAILDAAIPGSDILEQSRNLHISIYTNKNQRKMLRKGKLVFFVSI